MCEVPCFYSRVCYTLNVHASCSTFNKAFCSLKYSVFCLLGRIQHEKIDPALYSPSSLPFLLGNFEVKC